MHWRKVSGLAILGVVLGAPAIAATRVALVDAAEQGDKAGVRKLLGTGVDVNATQVDGTTALHWAAHNDDVDTVTLLLRAGAKANAVNAYGVAPLSEACINGNAAIVKLLLDAGADANTTMKGGETVLMLAARSGNAEVVKALLARDANTASRERLGQTALMWAAAEGHTEVVRALIAAGADTKAKIPTGLTPFFFAVRGGHLDTVREFLSAGIDVKAMTEPTVGRGGRGGGRGGPAGTSALMLAVQNGHFELAIALVDAGADPNDVRTRFTALHMVPIMRKPDSSDGSEGVRPVGLGRLSSADFVREIVKRGANINFRLPQGAVRQPGTSSQVGADGATAFLFAADRSDIPLMRLLLELGADPLMGNTSGTTPLMAAAGVGTRSPEEEGGEEGEALEAVKLLLGLGADINTVDSNGDTAMHGAAYNGYPLVAKLLDERGADPQLWSKPNKAGRTPLFIAEGHNGGSPRPDAAMIAALTKIMNAKGISTEGKRPKLVDEYERVPEQPKPALPQVPPTTK